MGNCCVQRDDKYNGKDKEKPDKNTTVNQQSNRFQNDTMNRQQRTKTNEYSYPNNQKNIDEQNKKWNNYIKQPEKSKFEHSYNYNGTQQSYTDEIYERGIKQNINKSQSQDQRSIENSSSQIYNGEQSSVHKIDTSNISQNHYKNNQQTDRRSLYQSSLPRKQNVETIEQNYNSTSHLSLNNNQNNQNENENYNYKYSQIQDNGNEQTNKKMNETQNYNSAISIKSKHEQSKVNSIHCESSIYQFDNKIDTTYKEQKISQRSQISSKQPNQSKINSTQSTQNVAPQSTITIITSSQINTQLPYQQYNIIYLNHCDCIQLDHIKVSNQYLVLSKFTIYFGQFNIKTSQKEGNGLILLRQFDKDFNSSYFHYEGQFQNDEIVGMGNLFNQKSKLIQKKGEWLTIKNTIKQPKIAIDPKIKILNETSLNQNKRIFPQDSSTIAFHDQLLNQNDLILLQRTSWLNSSIIDAYIDHLNYQDEINYWNQRKKERKQYQRLWIVPSWLFSWFHKGENDKNFEYFKQNFSQFEPIQYRIWEIYRKIGFVINSSNVHWYFVQLDLERMKIVIKDSMRGSVQKYKTTVDILENLFQKIDKTIKLGVWVCQQCLQQNNGYDCGAYTCINAKQLAEGTLGDIKNGKDMRNLLIKFIQN